MPDGVIRTIRWTDGTLEPSDVFEIESALERAGWVIIRRAVFQGVAFIEATRDGWAFPPRVVRMAEDETDPDIDAEWREFSRRT